MLRLIANVEAVLSCDLSGEARSAKAEDPPGGLKAQK